MNIMIFSDTKLMMCKINVSTTNRYELHIFCDFLNIGIHKIKELELVILIMPTKVHWYVVIMFAITKSILIFTLVSVAL